MTHLCHWPGCPKEVDPKYWGCTPHWFRLPGPLRSRIWKAYQVGQEISKTPSAEYIAVAREVQEWIARATTVKCADCGALMVLKESKHGPFYSCSRYPECDGTHGAHPNGAPLGVPANRATRAARIAAHQAFDALWQRQRFTRKGAYAWLSKSMGLHKDEAHISRFTEEQCLRLLQLLRERPAQLELVKP